MIKNTFIHIDKADKIDNEPVIVALSDYITTTFHMMFVDAPSTKFGPCSIKSLDVALPWFTNIVEYLCDCTHHKTTWYMLDMDPAAFVNAFQITLAGHIVASPLTLMVCDCFGKTLMIIGKGRGV